MKKRQVIWTVCSILANCYMCRHWRSRKALFRMCQHGLGGCKEAANYLNNICVAEPTEI